jgi:glycosyltransferase involved in cell wall biosynthesis
VGVCVKNCEGSIKEAIDSIINQDFPHSLMEVIFVDDGSTDRTSSVIESCIQKMDIQTKVFHQGWKGLGSARNAVVHNSSGDFIIWVDGDMLLSRDFVRRQVEFMEQNPSIGIAKGKYELTPGPNLASTLEIYSRAADKMTDFNQSKSKSMGTGACIYRLEAIQQAGGFDESIKGYGEDWDAECKVREVGWALQTTPAEWRDYERFGLSYKTLWRRYVIRGRDLYYFCRKNPGLLKFYKMLPPAGFLAGLRDAMVIYKMLGSKVAFLLPFHHMLKTSAWCCGFLRARLANSDTSPPS